MTTLAEFYALMKGTVEPRRRLTGACLDGTPPAAEDIAHLKSTLAALEAIPGAPSEASVSLDSSTKVTIEIGYEIRELHKDLAFLEQGEEVLVAKLLGAMAYKGPHHALSPILVCYLALNTDFILSGIHTVNDIFIPFLDK